MPLYILVATEEWAALENADRRRWLDNKLAKLREMQTGNNGIVWYGGSAQKAGDTIFVLWNLADVPAIRGFLDEVIRSEDTNRFFKVTFVQGGEPFTTVEALFRPFMKGD